ncbi:PqiC family protein [Kineobactrum salinum]|uniref:Membrane integrity-associated transporter subunit PqiC n=1 Tax=Kineobactrum salinum TaxID=2708301 RepID=A0A6C0U3C9_9GAMM|nr:PqiC family protein [Kineobactrum salinum]QIB66670.1 membrane integrity-associated transporter subunit PqiC [Kineobactrum salinum]
MTFHKHTLACCVLALLLVGCGSSPRNNYYVLSAETQAPSGNQEPSLGIGPVEIPEYLNRNSLVYRDGSNQLLIASFERWAEPLADGIQRVLGLNLSAELGTQNIRPHPWPRDDNPGYAIALWILSLDVSGQQAELVAEWRVSRPGESSSLARRITRLSRKLPAADWQGDDAAAAYSLLLQSLSAEIATVIRDAEADATATN